MSKKSHLVSLTILIIAAFIFGRSTYIEYLAWYYGTNDLRVTHYIKENPQKYCSFMSASVLY